jgi:hypothetical protein
MAWLATVEAVTAPAPDPAGAKRRPAPACAGPAAIAPIAP